MKKYLRLCLLYFVSIVNVSTAQTTAINTDSLLATGIEIIDAYVQVPISGQKYTAVFGVLKNTGKQPKYLVGVTTGNAAHAEIHSHTVVDGLMRMRQVKQIDVAAGTQVAFTPGGYQIMLFGVKSVLRTGTYVALTLEFSDGSLLPVRLPVKSIYDHAHH